LTIDAHQPLGIRQVRHINKSHIERVVTQAETKRFKRAPRLNIPNLAVSFICSEMRYATVIRAPGNAAAALTTMLKLCQFKMGTRLCAPQKEPETEDAVSDTRKALTASGKTGLCKSLFMPNVPKYIGNILSRNRLFKT